MKKYIGMILIACLFTTIFVSCATNNTIQYSYMSADWPMYDTPKEVIDAANVVYIGKIVDISFEILNALNAMPITKDTPEKYRELYTIYHIDIIQSYKGEEKEKTKLRIMGGLRDYHAEEQIELMEQKNANKKDSGIPIWENSRQSTCEIGGTYLFALYQFETGYPTILNLQQSIYSIEEPEAKDQWNISVKELVSEFGSDKREEFEANFQK